MRKERLMPRLNPVIHLVACFLLLAGYVYAQESLTITTYYPSPYGVYNELRLYPHVIAGGSCTDSTKGTMAYSSADEQLYLCQGAALGWLPLSNLWGAVASGSPNIHNLNTGFVGINTLTPLYRLHVEGTVYASGADLAEWVRAAGDVGAGDLVKIVAAKDKSGLLARTSAAYDDSAIGAVSSDPGLLIGKAPGKDYKTLAMAGQVPVKATAANGAIRPGDLLVSSNIRGYAMKAVFLDYDKAANFQELKAMIKENEKRKAAVIGVAITSLEKGQGKVVAIVK